MSRFVRLIGCSLCLLMMSLTGCNWFKSNSSTSGTTTTEDGSIVEESKGKAKPTIIPINRDPASLEGNWVMLFTNEGRDKYAWIFRLSKGADGKFSGEFVDSTKLTGKPQILETVVEDTQLKMKVQSGQAIMEFQGQFDGHVVRGNLSDGGPVLYAARLLNTNETSLTDYVDMAGPPASDVFQKAMRAMGEQPNLPEIVRIAREHRTSPTSLDVLGRMLLNQSRFQATDADLVLSIDEYVECAAIWGPRMLMKAELNSALSLINARRLPEVAMKHLARAEEVHADKSDEFKRYVANVRDEAEVQIGVKKSRSASEVDRAEAHVALTKLLEARPYNAEILFALASRCGETKQTDAAIAYYSDIVALPLLEISLMQLRRGQPPGDPTPSDQLKKLWIEQKGDDTGLEEHLAQTYRTKIDALIREIHEKSPKAASAEVSDHTVLLELFTCGQSPHSTAADLAVTAMSAEYPATDLIALRYHQHNPAPDGMANQDGEDRFNYYDLAMTPVVAVDGLIIDPNQFPYAGPMEVTGTAFNTLRQIVDLRRKQSTPIRLQLDAGVTDGQLSISAAVTGATEEQLPLLRLRLALAEDVVESRMPNGIRHHEMVVREMPGGARGIAPKKGELKFSYTMPVADLKLHLDEYIQRFEGGKKLEFPPEMKPPIRGAFHLVGWVQIQSDKSDEKNPSKLILQAATIPVTGLGPVTSVTPSPSAAPSNAGAPPAPALPE